jgi:hypothetical protein
MPRKLKTTANRPQATTIITIAITTACVAASPTAEELSAGSYMRETISTLTLVGTWFFRASRIISLHAGK